MTTTSTPLSPDLQQQSIAMIRGFAMDAPLHAKSGHQGTAMALAPLAHVLYSRVLRHSPADPNWPDRDRFVLSNGHASILQYSMLYLCGYGLELEDLKAFRSFGSFTPGHPEAGHTVGIEATTGPLGQGFANAVGMAVAERFLRDRFGPALVDHHIWAIAGDGCLMEGVSHEAASLAGHLGLGRLNVVFDDNRITIDGPTQLATTDDVGERFAAYGWHVDYLGEIADDCDALEEALLAAKAVEDRPSLLVLRSHIGHPSPKFTDNYEAHGNPFKAEDVSETKAIIGIPDEPFWSPPDVVAAYRELAAERCAGDHERWQKSLEAIEPEERHAWDAAWAGTGIVGWDRALPTFEHGENIATRQAIAKVLGACVDYFPGLISGAADLTGNTGTKLPDATAQTAETPGGRQTYFGVREHGMGALMVGMARHGGILPIGGTFFVFLDYMRPSVRLAALSAAKVVFVFSHDSVGVGEDGPTHQPVEHIATLRAIPNLQVIRPADANETVTAWKAAVSHNGPTALVLSRQGIPVCTDGSAVERGGGVVRKADGVPALVIVATGSEVALAVRQPSSSPVTASARRSSASRAGTGSPPRTPRSAKRSFLPACRCCPSRRPPRSDGRGSPTTRSASTASARARRATSCSTGSGSTSQTSWSARKRSSHGARSIGGMDLSNTDRLIRLHEEFDQSPWLDNLQRGYLTSGQLVALRDGGIRGLTSNPTIFQKAISGSADYDDQFRVLAADENPTLDDYWAMVLQDINGACDVFDPVYESSAGVDGYASVEVDPGLANDGPGTEAAARALHERLGRRNVMVKIPATAAGVAPIRQMLAEGRNINVTLIFGLDRYREVMEAYIEGLTAFAASGRRRPEPRRQRGQLLHLPGRHRGRPSPRGDRDLGGAVTARQGRSGPGQAGVQAVPGDVLGRALGCPGRTRRPCAASAVGEHLNEEPGVPGHAVRRQPHRPAHREHTA